MNQPLDGCEAKIERARETLEVLALGLGHYGLQQPPPFTVKGEHRGNEFVFLASGTPIAPLRFSVLAGEIVHHLRSSLDHLIHALIVQNGNEPSNKSQFPICTTEEKFQRACERGQIQGISNSAELIVRSVQPYNSPTPDDTVIHVVAEYDNTDKHRLLVVVNAAARLGEKIIIKDNPFGPKNEGNVSIVGLSPPAPKPISETGEIVFSIQFDRPTPEVIAEADIVPILLFDRCGRVVGAEVISTLRGLIEGVNHTLQSFAGEFQKKSELRLATEA